MWVEEEVNSKGKNIFRFREEYEDPLTGKTKKVSVVYAKNNRRIRRKALLELQEIINERQRTSAADMSFGALADEWLIDYKETVKSGTYKGMASRAKQLGDLRDILLPKLSPAHINRFLRNLKNKGLAKGSVSSYYTMFRMIIDFGLTYGDLKDKNIYEEIKMPNFPTEEPKEDWKFLEQDELDKLIKQLRELGYEEIARMCLLQTYTGTRNSELTVINFEKNIDWENKSILIDRTYVQSTKDYNSPKTGKSRTIYFNPETEKLLKEQIRYTQVKTMSRGLAKDPILFKNTKGAPLTSNNMWYIFNKVNIPYKPISTHIFRHTFIARAIEQNMPIHLIAKHVGDTVETIDKHYRHFTKTMDEQLKVELQDMSFGN